MNIEVLMATMFYENEALDYLKKVNLKTDAIIGNQCNEDRNIVWEYDGHIVQLLSRNERGVGRNRNTILFHSKADIIIFADNDVQYCDDYWYKVEKYYEMHPDADIVIFNYEVKRGEEPMRSINTKNKKANFMDVTKFGTYAITARREKLLKNRICFSLMFGGGAEYSCGEDSLFLMDCYKHGLKIYLCSETLGTVIHRESTWYKGITEKMIQDRGALYAAISEKLYMIYILYHAVKHRKKYCKYGSVVKVITSMKEGAKEFLK